MPTIKKQRKPTKRKKPIEEREFNWFGGNIRMNLYGRSGTGKTTLWSTFPKPIQVLLCSGTDTPGELRSINTAENRKVISPVVIRESSQIKEELTKKHSSGEDFATRVLDHATGLQHLNLKEILGLEEIPAQLSWGLATQQEWGQCALQMKELLRSFLSLTCITVVVAQEREFNIDSESDLIMPFVASALTPSVTGWLNPACDCICQTFIRQKTETKEIKIGKKKVKTTQQVGGVEYCLRTGPHGVYTTKLRMPRGKVELPEVIVDPSYAKIKKLIDQGA